MVTNIVKFREVKILLLLSHPRPGSFNHALASNALRSLGAVGHHVFFHDLYAEDFHPVMTGNEFSQLFSLDERIQLYTTELIEADGVVVFHPDWWGQPPAILKGWIDRVLRQGVAYDLEGDDGDGGDRRWKPLLGHKKGLVFCTSDATPKDLPPTLESLWTQAILGRCGMRAECHVLRGVRTADPIERREWMGFVTRTLLEWFPSALTGDKSSAAPAPSHGKSHSS